METRFPRKHRCQKQPALPFFQPFTNGSRLATDKRHESSSQICDGRLWRAGLLKRNRVSNIFGNRVSKRPLGVREHGTRIRTTEDRALKSWQARCGDKSRPRVAKHRAANCRK